MLEFTIGQLLTGLGLVLRDLAFPVLRGLVLRHALAPNVAHALLRGHGQLSLGLLDALDFRQMPVGLGVEGVDVLAVLRERLGQRLALGGQDVVLDTLHVGTALFLGLALPGGGVLARLRFLIDQAKCLGRRLTAQRGLLGERLGEQLGGLGDLRRLGLLGELEGRFFLVVAGFDGLDLLLKVGLHDGGKPFVGFGHLGGGVIDLRLRLTDRLFDLAQPGLELLQRGMYRLDATSDRFLSALAHGFEPLGDFLDSGGRRIHRTLGSLRPLARVGVHLRKDLVHLGEALLVALGGLGNSVRSEDGCEGFPAVLKLLHALDQHFHHEDARLADDLEFLGQPGTDFPTQEESAQHGKRRLEQAHAGHSRRHRQVGRCPGRRCGAGGCHCSRTCRLPGRDQGWDQAVDEHGQTHLGDALQPLHHQLQVLR